MQTTHEGNSRLPLMTYLDQAVEFADLETRGGDLSPLGGGSGPSSRDNLSRCPHKQIENETDGIL